MMISKISLIGGYLMVCIPFLTSAQSVHDRIKSTNMPVFPKIVNHAIPGAPLLGQPMLLNGTQQEIRTEKHGLAYPNFFDWNGDGKTDLLLGEFETGQKGSNIKVYLNQGSNKKPKYSGKYFYAKDVKGDTITAYQWCCIGIHPRFVDLDNDGYVDMLSGQYNPGKINWWRGGKDGFQPRQFVPQEGDMDGTYKITGAIQDDLDPRSNAYWNYTSASFADFDGDGKQDLFVGGFEELRVALNTGTNEKPKFGLRKYLLGLDGYPLSVVKPGPKKIEEARANFKFPHFAGVIKSFITPVDWDGDNVLDLLVTHVYGDKETKDPVVFFRGVKTDKGLRFEDAVPLFTAPEVLKTFPGCQPNIVVTDYNNDGIKDLVIGISIPTLNGYNVDSLAAWSFLHDLGIQSPGKDAGRTVEGKGSLDALKKKLKDQPSMKSFFMGRLKDEKYLTLRHRGYVYVMLGSKNPQKAVASHNVIAQAEVSKPVNQTVKTVEDGGPVQFQVSATALLGAVNEGDVVVKFKFAEGWHGYADSERNKKAGWIPTTVIFELPKGFESVGPIVLPNSHPSGVGDVLTGDAVVFSQKFTASRPADGNPIPFGDYQINVKIQYQVCNEDLCLPPVEEEVKLNFKYGLF